MIKLSKEIEAKRKLMAENYLKSHRKKVIGWIAHYSNGFNAAWSLAEEYFTKKYAPLKQECHNISGWLKRMEKLEWENEDYAPNFKLAFDRLQKALAKLEEG